MKTKLTDNMGLKILSVLCSILLWLIVLNIDDPVKPYTFKNIEVEIINPQVLADEGKVYEVLDGTNVVDVTVQAKRSILNTIGRENIVAVADLSEITFMNTVRINVSTNKYNDRLENITSSEESLRLNVENVKNVQMVVETVITGEPGDGYMVDDVTSAQNLVRLSGPESMISRVNKAVLEVSVEGITTGIQADYPIKLYDENEEEIDSSNITKSISNIGVKVTVLQKKQVALSFKTVGTPADGYAATGEITNNPETVLLAGSNSALQNVSVLELPAELIDLSGATGNVVTLVDIRDYLPEGTILADSSFNGRVSVTAYVEAEDTARIEVNTQNITIRNLPENLNGEIEQQEEPMLLTVRGLAQYMNAIDGITVTGYVDASGLQTQAQDDTPQLMPGIYQIPVVLELPEGVSTRETLTVTLVLTEKDGVSEE